MYSYCVNEATYTRNRVCTYVYIDTQDHSNGLMWSVKTTGHYISLRTEETSSLAKRKDRSVLQYEQEILDCGMLL